MKISRPRRLKLLQKDDDVDLISLSIFSWPQRRVLMTTSLTPSQNGVGSTPSTSLMYSHNSQIVHLFTWQPKLQEANQKRDAISDKRILIIQTIRIIIWDISLLVDTEVGEVNIHVGELLKDNRFKTENQNNFSTSGSVVNFSVANLTSPFLQR